MTTIATTISVGNAMVAMQWVNLPRSSWDSVKQKIADFVASEASAGQVVNVVQATYQESGTQ